jgi:hypothetical protein
VRVAINCIIKLNPRDSFVFSHKVVVGREGWQQAARRVVVAPGSEPREARVSIDHHPRRLQSRIPAPSVLYMTTSHAGIETCALPPGIWDHACSPGILELFGSWWPAKLKKSYIPTFLFNLTPHTSRARTHTRACVTTTTTIIISVTFLQFSTQLMTRVYSMYTKYERHNLKERYELLVCNTEWFHMSLQTFENVMPPDSRKKQERNKQETSGKSIHSPAVLYHCIAWNYWILHI